MSEDPKPTKLQWFQLSLRDLLWLMIVSGILLAWWQDRSRLQTSVNSTAKDAADRQAELSQLRARIDEVLAHALKLEEDLADVRSDARTFARASPLGWTLNLGPPSVNGVVLATHRNEGTVEINIGADHGLKPDDVLDVYRLGNTLATTRYLGQIRLTSIDKKSAVGAVLPNAKGTIEVADHVATGVK